MKTLIIYHYIAHYRKPIFEELQSSDMIDFQFASGVVVDSKIKVLQPDEFNYVVLDNHWFFKRRFLWQKKLLSLIKKDFDHIIFLGNPYFISTWFALIYCRLINKPVSIWSHGVTKNLNGSKLKIFKALWGLSYYIFVYGNYAKDKMISYGIKPEKIIIVYNSLDYERQVSIRRKLKTNSIFQNYFNNNHPVLIFTGRLTKIKKLHQILEALIILRSSDVFCNVLFLGEGPEKEELLKLVQSFNLEEMVWFYGACYDEKLIGDFYFNSKVCVSPGNVGLTAMHSLVYGTPVITHSNFQNQMPEFESIKDGLTGSFFIENDINDLASKIKFWIEMKPSIYENCRMEAMKKIDQTYNAKNQRRIFENILLSK